MLITATIYNLTKAIKESKNKKVKKQNQKDKQNLDREYKQAIIKLVKKELENENNKD